MKVSSLLDLETGHSIKHLAEEAKKDGLAMRRLTERSTKDASAVKALVCSLLVEAILIEGHFRPDSPFTK